MEKIILASASPRRKELLEQVGINFTVKPCDVNEEILTDKNNPADSVVKLACAKAEKMAENQESNSIILGADTIVVYKDIILGIPIDVVDAFNMIKLLSAKEHYVLTGYCIIRNSDKKIISGYEKTMVKFRDITDEEIKAYIKTKEPMDKAGAYGIQNKGCLFVERIEGDYFNVVGLPIMKIAYLLKFEFNMDII